MTLRFKRLRENARLPRRATPGSAGFDLCACLESPVTIAPQTIAKIPLGIASSPDDDKHVLCVFPRSGLASKNGITLVNAVGVVDADYRGEWFVPLINLSDTPFTVEDTMRIAQLVVLPVEIPAVEETSILDETERGGGGFGSSGLK